MLTFDPQKHEYRWHGRVVPHVTGVIAPLIDLSRIPAETLENARREGVHIHAMVNYYFEGRLDVDALHADENQRWLMKHYQALLKFIDETGFECWQSERQLFHPGLMYAGMTDCIGVFTKLKDADGASVLDVKRSLYGGPATGLQLAAYRKAWNDTEAKNAKDLKISETNRFTLQLREDGSYRLDRFEDQDDEVAFIACLHQHRWKEKHYGRP